MEMAIFGGGCFWCTEAIFKRIRGVKKVISGYAGDGHKNPSYGDVSKGETGHAEAIQVEFDPKEILYRDLVYIFFRTHDPTAINQQGADVGTQYRSIIFYIDENQKKIAEDGLKEAQNEYDSPIVTEIAPFKEFFTAEEYHQNYYDKNPQTGYCRLVIDPKIQKLEKKFRKYLK
ncbi:peptide-methionine (S)-S-oxide reductase MsrA [Candidatus Woesebacteria bacterium]|nr:peptide-methionine (S)-S-oxide reductase MsrA [Candidatus Woesebacteria bacterium]